jgi:hypothetical protein
MALADRSYAVGVKVRAILVCAVWLTFVLALDLPRSVAVAGVVFAFVFAWWDEQKEIATRADQGEYDEADYDDEPFEQSPPIFYV